MKGSAAPLEMVCQSGGGVDVDYRLWCWYPLCYWGSQQREVNSGPLTCSILEQGAQKVVEQISRRYQTPRNVQSHASRCCQEPPRMIRPYQHGPSDLSLQYQWVGVNPLRLFPEAGGRPRKIGCCSKLRVESSDPEERFRELYNREKDWE